MAGGETTAHLALKRAAALWAQQHRYAIVAPEVRLPHCRYRADVVAYKPGSARVEVPDERLSTTRLVRQPQIGTTVVFECKQSRSDFLNDSRPIRETLEQLRELRARQEVLERNLGIHYPSLRVGDSLFQEYESTDPSGHGHKTYDKICAEIRRLSNRLYGKTKFDKILRYRCANLCYLVTTPGVLGPDEVPEGWGLLMADDETVGSLGLSLKEKPVFQESPEATRLEFLHLAARAATRYTNRDFQLDSIDRSEFSP